MKYKLVIFDLDGTLVDTIADLGAAVNVALEMRHLPLHTLEEYRTMVGNGVRKLVQRAMPAELQGDEALLDALLADFMDYYIAHIDDRSAPYPGIPELLQELDAAGVRLAVASNKFQSGAEKLVHRIFPEMHFAAILGGAPGRPLKPDPAVVREICAAAGVEPGQTALVGDSGTDMATAAAAGIPAIAVTWGFRPEAARAAADRVAETAAELRDLLISRDCTDDGDSVSL
ncbi:MAG: HAD-IA family hydrolase [Bacteroidales bacterium]|nr:HAD-IA family hydrolase [Bacteroidales bacterium]